MRIGKKRPMLSFQADPDVERMVSRARKDGVKLSWLLNKACREYLVKSRFAGKKDLTEAKAA